MRPGTAQSSWAHLLAVLLPSRLPLKIRPAYKPPSTLLAAVAATRRPSRKTLALRPCWNACSPTTEKQHAHLPSGFTPRTTCTLAPDCPRRGLTPSRLQAESVTTPCSP